ncbi:hypothetical protein Tco_0455724 [Tanacetum coccineum]
MEDTDIKEGAYVFRISQTAVDMVCEACAREYWMQIVLIVEESDSAIIIEELRRAYGDSGYQYSRQNTRYGASSPTVPIYGLGLLRQFIDPKAILIILISFLDALLGSISSVSSKVSLLKLDKQVIVASKLRDTSLVSSFRRAPRGGIEEEQLLFEIGI